MFLEHQTRADVLMDRRTFLFCTVLCTTSIAGCTIKQTSLADRVRAHPKISVDVAELKVTLPLGLIQSGNDHTPVELKSVSFAGDETTLNFANTEYTLTKTDSTVRSRMVESRTKAYLLAQMFWLTSHGELIDRANRLHLIGDEFQSEQILDTISIRDICLLALKLRAKRSVDSVRWDLGSKKFDVA